MRRFARTGEGCAWRPSDRAAQIGFAERREWTEIQRGEGTRLTRDARAQYSAFGLEVVRVFVFFAIDFGEPAIFCRGVRGLGGALELFTGKRQLAFAE